MRVLIAGVGYQFLRDLSVGPAVVSLLQRIEWPTDVEVDDWSFGPIAVVQRLQDRPNYYDRLIFISSVERGREAGQVFVSRWDGATRSLAEVQARINEAVTGVISLDNLLIITQHFNVLPREVFTIEVEPIETHAGEGFTPPVEARLHEVVEAARRLALNE